MEFVDQDLAGCVSILLTATVTGLPSFLSMAARSRSGPAISLRPSTRKMIWWPVEGHAGLLEDLAGDVVFVVDHDPAGVDEFETLAFVGRRSRRCGRA